MGSEGQGIVAQIVYAARTGRAGGSGGVAWGLPGVRRKGCDRERLQILRGEAGMFGNTGEHSRPDFLAVMKRKHEVRPALTGHGAVRASLWPAKPREPAWPSRKANDSRGHKADTNGHGAVLAALDTFGENAKR